jgi:hypothetical protein
MERGSVIDAQLELEANLPLDCNCNGYCNWPICVPGDGSECLHDRDIEKLRSMALSAGIPFDTALNYYYESLGIQQKSK